MDEITLNAKLDRIMDALEVIHFETNTLIMTKGEMPNLAKQVDARFERARESYDRLVNTTTTSQ